MNATQRKGNLKHKTRKQSQNTSLITILNIKGEKKNPSKETNHKFSIRLGILNIFFKVFRTYKDIKGKGGPSSLERTDQERQSDFTFL